mmetsp:Transcript_28968/g.57658  ORF Transcript_28968/g.57658 Transcript_28968/m.57658 type:complete len:221 (+) Transcript_28968:860-1522(+)
MEETVLTTGELQPVHGDHQLGQRDQAGHRGREPLRDAGPEPRSDGGGQVSWQVRAPPQLHAPPPDRQSTPLAGGHGPPPEPRPRASRGGRVHRLRDREDREQRWEQRRRRLPGRLRLCAARCFPAGRGRARSAPDGPHQVRDLSPPLPSPPLPLAGGPGGRRCPHLEQSALCRGPFLCGRLVHPGPAALRAGLRPPRVGGTQPPDRLRRHGRRRDGRACV